MKRRAAAWTGCNTKKWQRPGVPPIACQSVGLVYSARFDKQTVAPAGRRSATFLWCTPWMAACLALAIVGCGKETAPPPEGPGGNTPFLITFEADRADGGKVTLDALKGRVVLVDIFGTWCPPCRRAAPVLVSLYERYRTQGFEVVGLAYERTETVEAAKEAVLAFKQDYGVPYVLAIGPEAVKGQIPRGFEGYPTMVLVDRQGVGRRHFVGFAPGEEAVLAEEIEKLLAEPDSDEPPP